MTIHEKVHSYNTKHVEGFVKEEIFALIKDYPDMDMKKFYAALNGVTGMLKDGDEITYHSDLELAIRCGTEKRGTKGYEWD